MPRKYVRLSVDKALDDELKSLIHKDFKLMEYRVGLYEKAVREQIQTLKKIKKIKEKKGLNDE